MNVFFELAERNALAHRHAVAYNVQVRLRKIQDFLSAFILYIGITNIPLARYGPVKDLSTRWHFMYAYGDITSKNLERVAHAVSGDAAADRINIPYKCKNIIACTVIFKPACPCTFDE